MTKSSVAQTSEQETELHRSPHPVRSILTVIFRLLLLGIGGGFATLAGMAIAQYYPSQTQQQPLLETVFRRSTELLSTIQRQSGGSDNSEADQPAIAPDPAAPAPASPIPVPTENSLQPNSPDSASADAPPTIVTTAQRETVVITLPSDTLFATDPNTFRPESQAILDSIVNDLQRHAGKTVRVAAHTDGQETGSSQENLDRSFAQAQLVERYLVNRLGDQYHWVVIGYGDTRPLLPNDTPTSSQRNRRIEITIEPQ